METILVFNLRGRGWSSNAKSVLEAARQHGYTCDQHATPCGAIINVRFGSYEPNADAMFKLVSGVGAVSMHHLP